MRGRPLFSLALLLLATTATRTTSANSAESYESIQAEVVRAFDTQSEDALRNEFLKEQDRAIYSFGIALIDLYSSRMFGSGGRKKIPVEANEDVMRKRIKRCMAHDPTAAYPVALYAWFVNVYREPGMKPPHQELAGTTKVKLANGRSEEVPVYKVTDDPALRARVRELNEQALRLDKNNPMAKYGLAAGIKEPIESAKQLWSTLGEPGQFLWETDALARIKLRAKDDPDTQARVAKRVEQLKAKIGKDSPRLKAYGL